MTATIAATAATSATHRRRGHVIVRTIFAVTTLGREYREQAAHFLAMTFHADNIVGMFMADQQIKLCFAVRAIVLV